MDPDLERRALDLFESLCDLPEGERERLLGEQCSGLPGLRERVERLLVAEEETGSGAFLDVHPEDDRELPLPAAIGPYRILGRLGVGGMGIVLEAEQAHPRRRVALKVLRPLVSSPRLEERLRREAEVLGRLQHEGIARVLDAGTFELAGVRQPYLAMERIEGVDLISHAHAQRLDLRARLALLARVADALQHAHDRGVVHRDLKPENVLVDAEGVPRVLDFGVALLASSLGEASTRMTAEGQLIGTLAYMAPEQVRGELGRVGPRTDVHGLGALGYELVTGVPPHETRGLDGAAAMRLVLDSDPVPAGRLVRGLDRDVELILAQALAQEPERRYAAAGDLAADLRRFLAHRPVAARRPSRAYLARRFARRNPALVTTLAVIALAAVLVSVLGLHALEQGRQASAASRELDRVLYTARMRLASEAATSPAGVRELPVLLDRWAVPAAGAEDPRGWEWFHFEALARDRHRTFEVGGGSADVFTWPSGRGLAVAGGGHAELLDLPGGAPLVRLRHGSGRVVGLSWSEDGERVLLAHADRQLVVHELSGDVELLRMDLPAPASEVAVSAAAGRVLVSGRDKVGHLHDLATGELLWSREGVADDQPGGLRFSPDGRFLAGAGPSGAFEVRDAADGSVVFANPESRGDQQVLFVAWSADGRYLAYSRAMRHVWLVEVGEWRVRHVLDAHRLRTTGVAFSSDGARLASCSWDGSAAVWDVETGLLLQRRVPGVSLECVAFTPGGEELVVSSQGTELLVLDLTIDPGLRRGWTWSGHSRQVGQYARSHDGVWSAGHTGEGIALWRTEDGPPRGPQVRCAGSRPALSRSGRYLAVYDDTDGWWARVHSVPDMGVVAEYPLKPDNQARFVWSDVVEERLTVLRDRIQPWTVDVGREGPVTELADQTLSQLAWDDRRSCGYALHADGTVSRLDRKGKVLARGPRLPGRLWCMAPAPDRSRVAVGSQDGFLYLVDTDSMELSASLRTSPNLVSALAWSPDGSRLAVGDLEGGVCLVDARRAEIVARLWPDEGQVSHLAWSPDGSALTACTGRGMVVEWLSEP